MKKFNKFNSFIRKALAFFLIFNLIVPLSPFSVPLQQKAEAAVINDPGEPQNPVNDRSINYISDIWNGKAKSDGFWTVYVDGQQKGTAWCFGAGNGGYNTLDPSVITAWVRAFNGNPDYVEDVVRPHTIKGKTTFERYYLREVADASGAYVTWEAKKVYVTTSKFPEGKILLPYGDIYAGESANITLDGSAFKGSNLSYKFSVNGSKETSGIENGRRLTKPVSYTFKSPGTYILTLELTDQFQRTTVVEKVVTVKSKTVTPPPSYGDNAPPTARFDMPSFAEVGDKVNVTDRSFDPDGTIVSRTWKVTPSSGVSKSLGDNGGTITFNNPGTYEVSLTVTDDDGATDTYSREISVGEPPPPPEPKEAPTADFSMPSRAGQGETVRVRNRSYDNDGKIVKVEWDIRPSSGVVDDLDEDGGTIVFNKTGTYTVRLTVTDDDGLTDSAEREIEITNDPPTAKIKMTDTVIQGQDVIIRGDVEDPEGELEKIVWTVTPSDGMVGKLEGEESTVYFDKEGTYTIRLYVEDKWGLSAEDTKTITVQPAIPKAALEVQGCLKQNRKVILDSTKSLSPTRYPILVNQNEWEIIPLTSGVTSQDIKILQSSPMDRREVLFKKPGDYKIRLRVRNEKHASEWVEQTITIGPDEKPIANFTVNSIFLRDPENGNLATIEITDTSYSPDGDTIAKRVWKYKFDSNNDGSFSDENWVIIDDKNNLTTPSFTVSHVGRYLVELEVQEAFGQETIPSFISDQDYQKADTLNKSLVEKVFRVENTNPFVDFEVSAKKKADIVFTVGQTDPVKVSDLSSKINTYIKSKLAAYNIDVKISTIETLTQNVQNSFTWIQNVDPSVGQIYFQNNGTKIQMYGNRRYAGFNKIYTNVNDPNINSQEITFSYTIDYGDSFDGAGILFGTNVVNNLMNGYAVFLSRYGTVKLYQLNNWSSSTNQDIQTSSNATYLGTVPMGSSGTYTLRITKNTLTIIQGGVEKGTIALPQHYGWGFGFFSDHYSHNCSDIGQFSLDNISMKITRGKTLDEALKEPEWRENASHFLVNISDVILTELNDENKNAEILAKLMTHNIYFIELGTSANKSQIENFIARNSGNGIFYYNNDMDAAMNNLGNYILQKILDAAKTNIQYVLLGEEVEYKTYYADYENDPEYQRHWKYVHDPYYFDNSMGLVSYHNNWIPNPITVFDKVGKFDVTFEAQDTPVGSDDRFAEYRRWSSMPLDKLTIYVHRKPIAQFTVSLNGLNITLIDTSYDLDHQSEPDKGIVQREWKWKNANDTSWKDGKLSGTLTAGQNYLIQLRVKDKEGAWSDPYVQFVTTKPLNLPPVAQFSVSPNPLPISKTLIVEDHSYDPNGDPIVERHWTVEKDGVVIYQGSSLPTSYSSYGVGHYKVTLKVKDNPKTGEPLWSEPYSQTFQVIPDNRKPVADFTIDPTLIPLDEGNTITITDKSTDPDGDPIVAWEWQVKKANGSWVSVSAPPTDLEYYGIGTHYIRLRVKDQPRLPQLDPLWSDWVERSFTVIPGNQKPIARFTVTPNPVPADEPVTYNDTSYDPEGKPITERVWTVKCLETGQVYQYFNQTPPRIFEETGWGINGDGVGTYEITLKVKDSSPNGISPALWSDPVTQILVVEDPLRINGLTMTAIVNPPLGTQAPVVYPVATPVRVKAGYRMTFRINTNGGDRLDIKLYANGQPLTVHTDSGDTNTITMATVRKNASNTFSFWTDEDLPKGTVLDMKIILTKTRHDGTTKSIVNTELGEHFAVIVGSSKEDSNINLTR